MSLTECILGPCLLAQFNVDNRVVSSCLAIFYFSSKAFESHSMTRIICSKAFYLLIVCSKAC